MDYCLFNITWIAKAQVNNNVHGPSGQGTFYCFKPGGQLVGTPESPYAS